MRPDDDMPEVLKRSGRFLDTHHGSVLLGVCLVLHLYFASAGWRHSILEWHAFRQCQTALTSYHLAKEGFRLDYETPVLGAPWAVPFEFPLHQALAALVHRASGMPLNESGRTVSLFFFYASLPPLFQLVRTLTGRRETAQVATALMLACPVYIFWSRAFLIESTALCFSLVFLVSTFETLRRERARWFALMAVSGALAGAVKVTTFALALALAGVLVARWCRNLRRAGCPFLQSRPVWMAATGLAVAVAATLAWTAYADAVKSRNMYGSQMISSSMAGWNHGPWEMKTSPASLKTLVANSLPYTLGSWGVRVRWQMAVLAGLFVFCLARKPRQARHVLWLLGAFALGPLVFTNLYLVHTYYWYANAVYLVLAVALVCGEWLAAGGSRRVMQCAVLPLLLAAMFTTYLRVLYPKQAKEHGAEFLALAEAVRARTSPQGVLVVVGYDWDSSLPYYAERRALMQPHGLRDHDPFLEPALDRLDPRQVEALVWGPLIEVDEARVQRWAERFKLSPEPVVNQAGFRVYARGQPLGQEVSGNHKATERRAAR